MRRIPQLDGLRAAAILSVFFHHALHLSLMWMGVDLFFVLSGFLITSILIGSQKASLKSYFTRFYSRRFRRIIPPYALFLLIVCIFYTFDWSHLWYWYVFFGANIVQAAGRGGTGVLNVLWSLAVEEQFYLFWPIVVFFVSIGNAPRYLWIMILSAPVARAVATYEGLEGIYYLTPFRMDLLAAGALIAYRCHRDSLWPQEHRTVSIVAMLSSACALLVLTIVFRDFRTYTLSYLFNIVGYSLIVILFSSLLTFCLTLKDGDIYRLLTFKVLRYIGQISYMMYLIHLVMIDLFGHYGFAAGVVGGLAGTIAFSSLTWYTFERRLVRAPHRKLEVAAREAD